MGDILLASSDVNLLFEMKKLLSSNFNMKDLGEASFVLGIEIQRDRRKGVLELSQKVYLEKILKKYSMHASKPTPAPIVKDDSFAKFLFRRNPYEIDQMKAIPVLQPSKAYNMLKYVHTLT